MQSQDPQALSVLHISQKFGKRGILKDVSFTCAPGSCTGILGINGGGKSTLLAILAGIRAPRSGSFTAFGHDMFKERGLFKELIAYLPQENPLLLDLSVRDNLRLWYGKNLTGDLPILTQLALKDLLKEKVKNLSGGMKRRLAIACAVAEGQKFLLLDEPTSSLDLYQKGLIRTYIKDYISSGGIVILSTHDPDEITFCTDLYYLEGGVSVPVTSEEAIRRLRLGIGDAGPDAIKAKGPGAASAAGTDASSEGPAAGKENS